MWDLWFLIVKKMEGEGWWCEMGGGCVGSEVKQ